MILNFGDISIDTDLLELRAEGLRRDVEPQVFRLLCYLIENRDRVVGKDELVEAVWGGLAISDSALNARISAARRAVGDSGKEQAIIRTLPRLGFRFVAEVRESATPEDATATAIEFPDNAGAKGTDRKPVVAVLPFDNLSADEGQQYFADGMSEDLITALTKHRWLLVIARNSTFVFRGHSRDIREVARDLGADYVVEGSVRKAGRRVRVTAQLIEGASGNHIWAQNYDCDEDTLFDVQDDIIATIVGRIEPELGEVERRRVRAKSPASFGAWDNFHLGLSRFYRFNEADNTTAQALFRRCIELDPEFAPAYSWLSYAIVLRTVYFEAELDPVSYREAIALAERAIDIDDQDAVAHFAAGRVHLAACEYDAALTEMERAIELNPCLAVAYCGMGDSLAYEGRMLESIAQFEKAIHLSPHDPFRWAFFSYRALAHLFLGEFAEAVEWADRAARVPNSHYWANSHLVSALGHLGGADAAKGALERLLQRKPGFSQRFARDRLFYIKDPAQLELYLEGLAKAGVPAG